MAKVGSMIRRSRSGRDPPRLLERLSRREREILALMAVGQTNHKICGALSLSPKTVESHVRSVFKKLGLRQGPDEHRRVVAGLHYLEATQEEVTPRPPSARRQRPDVGDA